MLHRWSLVLGAVSLCLVGVACAASGRSGSEPSYYPDGGDDSGSSGTVKPTGDSGTGKDSGKTSSGPIQIKNLSVSKSSGSTTNIVSLTFALQNNAPQNIERVKEISVTISDETATYLISTCQDPKWIIGAGDSSGVLEVDLTNSTSSSYIRYGTASCSSSSETYFTSLSGTVTLEIKGLLEDATPWTAESEAEF